MHIYVAYSLSPLLSATVTRHISYHEASIGWASNLALASQGSLRGLIISWRSSCNDTSLEQDKWQTPYYRPDEGPGNPLHALHRPPLKQGEGRAQYHLMDAQMRRRGKHTSNPGSGSIRPASISLHALVQVDLGVGAVNGEGLRGTKAVRDMKANQIAVHLPMHLVVELGEPGQTSEVCASMHLARSTAE